MIESSRLHAAPLRAVLVMTAAVGLLAGPAHADPTHQIQKPPYEPTVPQIPRQGSGSGTQVQPPPPAPANGGQCVIAISGGGYSQNELQRWEISGPGVPVNGRMRYPMMWTTSGSGSYVTNTGSTVWTINAGKGVNLDTLKLPSGKWLIQQYEAQQRVAGGITGTQTLNGSKPAPISGEAFEFMYGSISAPGTATHVDSTNQFPVDTAHKWGYMQPAGPTGTITCEWHVNP